MTTSRVIVFMILLALPHVGRSQGFVNLDFESADLAGYSPPSVDVPTASALPGWTATFFNSGQTDGLTQVYYDVISLGGPVISIIDSKALSFEPIDGKYSAFLFGGGAISDLASASISQTGVVPVGTKSIQCDAYNSGAPFIVILGNQTISMVALQSFGNYTLYGGNLPSGLAGQSETLSFIEPPAAGAQPSFLELDDIVFSPSAVPEPNTLALGGVGTLLLVFLRSSASLLRAKKGSL